MNYKEKIVKGVWNVTGGNTKPWSLSPVSKSCSYDTCIKEEQIDLFNVCEMVVGNSCNAALILDKRGTVIMANPAAFRLLERQGEEIIGMPVETIFCTVHDNGFSTSWLAELLNSIECEKEKFNLDLSFVFRDREKSVLVDICLLRNGKSDVTGFVILLKDITEKKIREEEMARQNMIKLVNQLAFGLAHEIRNPLTTVRGFVQLFHENLKHPESNEYLQLVLDELDRANSLIKDFLLCVRPAAPDCRLVTLGHIIDEAVALIRPEAVSKGLWFKFVSMQDSPFMFLDQEQIFRAVSNVLQNAVDFTESGSVTITMSHDYLEKQAIILIKDTGPGIVAEMWPRIFEPFFTTKEDAPGLGLSLAYQIIKCHGGSISVYNNNEGGATFQIILPHIAACY